MYVCICINWKQQRVLSISLVDMERERESGRGLACQW